MAFSLDSPAEAYAAVSLLVVGADGLGTMEERSFLFQKLGALDVFEGHDAESFGALLGGVMGRMFADLSEDGAALNADATDHVCAGARSVLDASQCDELFASAVRLAYSDGLADEERDVLLRVAGALGLDAAAAEDAIARAAG